MNKILGISATALILGSALTANAAGFQLSEYSTTNLGRSFAGVGMVGDDFSAIGYNPAGMVFNKKSGIQFGASTVGIRSHTKGSVKYSSPVSPVKSLSGKTDPYIVRVLPQAFGQYQVNDRVTAGIGVYVPFGLVTDYDNNWFGRTHAGRSSVQALNISPALSVKATDYLSLGASVNIQHISANLTSGVETNMPSAGGSIFLGGKTDLEGDDLRVGYTLGVALEPAKGTRFGISYRSHVEHKLHGDNTVTGTGAADGKYDINAKITTPETVTLSANQQLTNQWSVSATARWTRWSRFKNLTIYRDQADTHGNYLLSDTKENWRNTWFYALGTDYKYNDNWTFRLGAAYDDAAVKSPMNRTARIPDGRRWWTSFGLSYEKNNWQFDGGYAHLFVKSGEARHGSEGSSEFHAKYNSNANIFSLAAQYKF